MNQQLFDRATGNLSPQAFARLQTSHLVNTIQHAPRHLFDGGERENVSNNNSGVNVESQGSGAAHAKIWAHQTGVNALSVDIEGRILISGGADSSIKLWNLDGCSTAVPHTFSPTGEVRRNASAHKFGITHLSFYPFDSAAFLSSSYDHHLKLFATETLAVSADFDLDSVVYTHALSPIANHLLVACATQNPAVRLIDLRSGASTHSLVGHHGAILSLAWSPTVEHILASGGIDGTVHLWDIRKSSGALGVLDMEDSTGVTGVDGLGKHARARDVGKAHHGAVNGTTWTDDGSYIISAGHDERVRVWDSATGANTLANFGPTLKNGHLSTIPIMASPTSLTPPANELLLYPNERDLLIFELHEGKLVQRLKVPGPSIAAVRSRTGERNIKNRITALAWRGLVDGVYSAHSDGQIRAWLPRSREEDRLDREYEADTKRLEDDETERGKRKREVLEDVFRSLTKQKISFG